eukprot:351346-Chlamydomonas_euryale.AAC.6
MFVAPSRLVGRWLCFVNMPGHLCSSRALPHDLPVSVQPNYADEMFVEISRKLLPAARSCFFNSTSNMHAGN